MFILACRQNEILLMIICNFKKNWIKFYSDIFLKIHVYLFSAWKQKPESKPLFVYKYLSPYQRIRQSKKFISAGWYAATDYFLWTASDASVRFKPTYWSVATMSTTKNWTFELEFGFLDHGIAAIWKTTSYVFESQDDIITTLCQTLCNLFNAIVGYTNIQ